MSLVDLQENRSRASAHRTPVVQTQPRTQAVFSTLFAGERDPDPKIWEPACKGWWIILVNVCNFCLVVHWGLFLERGAQGRELGYEVAIIEIINNTRDGIIIFFNETTVNATIGGKILISQLGPMLP